MTGKQLCLAGILVLAASLASGAEPQIVLGVVGDSLSDEYAEDDYPYARNWVEQLAEAGITDVGRTAAEAGLSDWGDTRRSGYEYNWAFSGADTGDLAGQVAGLVPQVAAEGITHIVGLIGANDFDPMPGGSYWDIYYDNLSAAEIETVISDRLTAATSAMQSLKATGAKVAWGNVPDYGIAPTTQSFYTDPVKREKVTTVIREVNDRLADAALAEGIPLVDVLGLTKVVFGENASPNSTLLLGNVELKLLESDTLTNTNPTAAFVHDGEHVHTTIQGALGSLFMEAFNVGYGDNISLFSEEEILDHAGIPYGGQDTLFSDIGASGYSDFVLIPEPSLLIPEPSTICMLAAAGLLLLAAGFCRGLRGKTAAL